MKKPIPVIISGMPGAMARLVAARLQHEPDFNLHIAFSRTQVGEVDGIKLVPIEHREEELHRSIETWGTPIIVDYTHPSHALANAAWYCQQSIPFVMGTTSSNPAAIADVVKASNNLAVVAPNMAAPIVMMQFAIAEMAKTFGGAFADFTLEVTESHQAAKADTSGTARAIIASFRQLGIEFEEDQIRMIRDPDIQLDLGVPGKYIDGHGWHTYRLRSSDGTVNLKWEHNVNGRAVYVDGTIRALRFLARQVDSLQMGEAFSMIDVLRGQPR